jgi:hypothetical protein
MKLLIPVWHVTDMWRDWEIGRQYWSMNLFTGVLWYRDSRYNWRRYTPL